MPATVDDRADGPEGRVGWGWTEGVPSLSVSLRRFADYSRAADSCGRPARRHDRIITHRNAARSRRATRCDPQASSGHLSSVQATRQARLNSSQGGTSPNRCAKKSTKTRTLVERWRSLGITALRSKDGLEYALRIGIRRSAWTSGPRTKLGLARSRDPAPRRCTTGPCSWPDGGHKCEPRPPHRRDCAIARLQAS